MDATAVLHSLAVARAVLQPLPSDNGASLAHELALLARLKDTLRLVDLDTVSAVNQAEAARILGVHPATVSRWVAAGHFEMVAGPGKHPLIAAHSLHRPTPKSKGRG